MLSERKNWVRRAVYENMYEKTLLTLSDYCKRLYILKALSNTNQIQESIDIFHSFIANAHRQKKIKFIFKINSNLD